jgi:uncharacterized membrane protein YsdA (DUF1294 family)
MFLGHLVWQVLAGMISLVYFAWDKRQSKVGGWRVPEQRLHFLTLIGGWLGAIIGRRYLRHKSQKPVFMLVESAATILHLAISGILAYGWIAT